MPLVEGVGALVEPPCTGLCALAFEHLGCFGQMPLGMVPIDQLLAVGKVQRRLIPDPGCAIAQHHRIACALPSTPACFAQQQSAKRVRATKMSHVGRLHALRQRQLFARERVWRQTGADSKDAAQLDLFPALLADVDDGAIERNSHAFLRLTLNGRLPVWGSAVVCLRCRSCTACSLSPTCCVRRQRLVTGVGS
jgi:hypothetical protein